MFETGICRHGVGRAGVWIHFGGGVGIWAGNPSHSAPGTGVFILYRAGEVFEACLMCNSCAGADTCNHSGVGVGVWSHSRAGVAVWSR